MDISLRGYTMPIIKTREHDLMYLDITDGNYYACEDSDNFYYDNASERTPQDVEMLYTEKARLYGTIPVEGKRYYVWETNELWIYRNGWKVLVGGTKPADGYIPVQGDSGYNLERIDGTSADSNGLLGDGSVCIRDENRIIKGKAYIDKETDNLVFSSFMGGGISFFPNGSSNTKGALLINPHMKLAGVRVYSYADNNYIQVSLTDYLAHQEQYDNATNYLVTKRFEIVSDGYGVYNGQLNTTDEIYVHLDQSREDKVTVTVTKTSETIELDTHESDYMTAKDFTFTGTSLDDDGAKTFAELSAYDAMGVDVRSDVYIVGGVIDPDSSSETVDGDAILEAIVEGGEGDKFKLIFGLNTLSTRRYRVFHEGNLTAENLQALGIQDELLAHAVRINEGDSSNIKQLRFGGEPIYPYVQSSGLIGPLSETAVDISDNGGDWNNATRTGFYTNSEASTNSPYSNEDQNKTGIPIVVHNFGTYLIQETRYPDDGSEVNKFRTATYSDGWSWESWSTGNIATRLSTLESTVTTMGATVQSLVDRVDALETRAGTFETTYQKKIESGDTLPITGEEGEVFIKINSGGA